MADKKQSLLRSRGLLSSLQRRAPPGLAWKAIPRLDAEMQESGSALAASWPESGVTVCLSFEVIITGGEKKKKSGQKRRRRLWLIFRDEAKERGKKTLVLFSVSTFDRKHSDRRCRA